VGDGRERLHHPLLGENTYWLRIVILRLIITKREQSITKRAHNLSKMAFEEWWLGWVGDLES